MEQTTDSQPILGRIYKITSSQTDACYIGSTTITLTKRFSIHKYQYSKYLIGEYHYTTSFDIIQHGDANIELVVEGLFPSKRDMERVEGHYIDNTPNAVNKRGAGMTRTESRRKSYLHHRDEELFYGKERYINHREKIFSHSKEPVTCDLCGGTHTRANKWNHTRSKKHQAALLNLEQEQFHSASSTQTPEESDDEISSESFYLSMASSG